MGPYNLNREHMRGVYQIFQRYALEDQRNYWQRASARYRKAAGQVNVIVAVFAFITGFSAALAGLLVSAYLVDGSFANQGECAALQSSRNLVASLRGLGVIESTEDIASLQSLSVGRDPGAEGAPVDSAAVDEALAALVAIDATNCDFIQGVVNVLMIAAVVAPAIGGAFTTLASLYQWDRTVSIYDGALENLEVADSQSPMNEMDDLTYKAALRAYIENTLRVMAEETAQWGQSVRTPPQLEAFVEEEKQKAARAVQRTNTGPMNLNTPEGSSGSQRGTSGPTSSDKG